MEEKIRDLISIYQNDLSRLTNKEVKTESDKGRIEILEIVIGDLNDTFKMIE